MATEFKCKACGEQGKLAKFKVVDWATDGFTASCQKCDSLNITYSVHADDINCLQPKIASKMLSAMYDC